MKTLSFGQEIHFPWEKKASYHICSVFQSKWSFGKTGPALWPKNSVLSKINISTKVYFHCNARSRCLFWHGEVTFKKYKDISPRETKNTTKCHLTDGVGQMTFCGVFPMPNNVSRLFLGWNFLVFCGRKMTSSTWKLIEVFHLCQNDQHRVFEPWNLVQCTSALLLR